MIPTRDGSYPQVINPKNWGYWIDVTQHEPDKRIWVYVEQVIFIQMLMLLFMRWDKGGNALRYLQASGPEKRTGRYSGSYLRPVNECPCSHYFFGREHNRLMCSNYWFSVEAKREERVKKSGISDDVQFREWLEKLADGTPYRFPIGQSCLRQFHRLPPSNWKRYLVNKFLEQ